MAQQEGRPPLRLRPHQRLRDPRDFQRVYAGQEALHGPTVVVFFRVNGLAFSRLGVSVGRKHGNAVRRNRIKRVLREAFRLSQRLLPSGFDFVLIPRRQVKEYRTDEVRDVLLRLAAKLPCPGEGTREGRRRTDEPPGASGSGVRRGVSRRIVIKRPGQDS